MTLIRFLVVILLLILGFCAPAFSALAWIPRREASVIEGPVAYAGDLGGNNGHGGVFLKDYTWRSTRDAQGLYLAYHPEDGLGIRLSLLHEELAGVGTGAACFVSDHWSISGEIMDIKTFTDYLDDVRYLPPAVAPIADYYMSNKSPLRNSSGSGCQPGDKRGDPGNNDGYIRFELKAAIRFGSTFNPWPLSGKPMRY